jgi:4a-hydroxytetrahydrobiopterin dehydratase
MNVLSADELQRALEGLTGWSIRNGKLHRELRFQDFVTAFGFMTHAALISEQMGHHPEWANVYNQVTIDLWTHDKGGVTQKDISWANAVEKFIQST